MEHQPLVAVFMVTYNHENFIKEAIDSVLMQVTDFHFKIFIGEDCSIDDTRNICLAYKHRYPDKIELILQPKNVGVQNNTIDVFNCCSQSGARYIAMLEGDDYWIDPSKLQKQVDFLNAHPHLIACHHWHKYSVFKDGVFTEIKAPKKGQGYLADPIGSVKQIFANQLRLKSRTIMFRNVISDKFFPVWFQQVAFGDVPLTMLLGQYGDFGFIDEEMAVYRQTGSGVSTEGMKEIGLKEFRVEHFKNWIEIWDFANKHYEYKYNIESNKSVSYFYSRIIKELPFSSMELYRLLKYNFFTRSISIMSKLKHGKYIVRQFSKKLIKELKNKLGKK